MIADSYYPGQRVRFLGRKARVATDDEWIWGAIPESWERWAVPVEVKDSGSVCIAHVDHLTLDY